jgi:hypothetical protein
MTTPPPTTTTAATGSAYQQLRGHLHYLRLDAAAEALPATLDQAAADKLSRQVGWPAAADGPGP